MGKRWKFWGKIWKSFLRLMMIFLRKLLCSWHCQILGILANMSSSIIPEYIIGGIEILLWNVVLNCWSDIDSSYFLLLVLIFLMLLTFLFFILIDCLDQCNNLLCKWGAKEKVVFCSNHILFNLLIFFFHLFSATISGSICLPRSWMAC